MVPNRNGAAYLAASLDSIIAAAQSVPTEIIVVDGASTDGSVDVIESYRDRISLAISEPDRGQYDAVNKGFGLARGDVLTWLNGDDVYFRPALETVASIFAAQPQVEWLTTLARGSIAGTSAEPQYSYVPGYSAEAFHDGRYVPVQNGWSYGAIQQESTFWRRSLWQRAGGRLDTSLQLAADFELWARFFKYAILYGVDVPLAAYRSRPGQRGADTPAYMAEARSVLPAAGRAPHPLLRPLLRRTKRYQAVKLASDHGSWTPVEYRYS